MFTTILAFIIVLGVLILVHEVGHFASAKAFGVKVKEFAIGFPPRILSFTRKETKYTIGALIFGGYVSMLGEDEESKDPRAFNNQSPGKRFIISVAGVLMNFVLAWILLSIGFAVGMTPIATLSQDLPGEVIKPQIFVASVKIGSPAEKAGIKAGDQITELSFGSEAVVPAQLSDVSNFTQSHLGKTIDVRVKRDNEITAKKAELSSDSSGPLGVGILNQSVIKTSWYMAPVVAAREVYNITTITFSLLGDFFRLLFSTGHISDQVGGPVAIFSLSGIAARAGIITFLQYIAVLSINLGLVNILPFPALDGGRALFILLEKLFGKRIVKENVENIIHNIGFALLILLILAVTYKDIVRKFQ